MLGSGSDSWSGSDSILVGFGQTRSRTLSLQKSLIWLNRYHCRLLFKPGAGITSGRSVLTTAFPTRRSHIQPQVSHKILSQRPPQVYWKWIESGDMILSWAVSWNISLTAVASYGTEHMFPQIHCLQAVAHSHQKLLTFSGPRQYHQDKILNCAWKFV